jgi:hypothetical protein
VLIFVPFVLGSEEETPTVKVPHKGKAILPKATPVHAKPQSSSEEDSSSDDDDAPRKYNSLQLRL